jgi:hypothetical protein
MKSRLERELASFFNPKRTAQDDERSRIRTANEHADADEKCGREWSCTCAACRWYRRELSLGGP